MDSTIDDLLKFGIDRHEHIIKGATHKSASKELFSPLRREHYSILFSGYAGATHFVDNKAVRLPPFSVLFIGPDRLSHFDPEPQMNTHILTFSDLFYNRCPKDAHFLQNSPLFHNFGAVYLYTPPEEALAYSQSLVFLLYEAQEKFAEEIYRDLAHNIVQQILIVGTTRHHRSLIVDFEENVDNLLVLQFRKLLEAHFVEEKAVMFYTDKLHVTDRRLSQATRNVLNMSPKEVISRKIMSEAKWQLIYTSKTIKEISADLGYLDEHNFSSFFLKNEGVRPKVFQSQSKLAAS